MTPPISECPASSELLASSSRSQGISGGGVKDGALVAPLCSHCGSETARSGTLLDRKNILPEFGEHEDEQMLGAFGDISKLRSLKVLPDVVYPDVDHVKSFKEDVIPVVWAPKASRIVDGVEDVDGRHYLFFNSSRCIAKPSIMRRNMHVIEKMAELLPKHPRSNFYKSQSFDLIRRNHPPCSAIKFLLALT